MNTDILLISSESTHRPTQGQDYHLIDVTSFQQAQKLLQDGLLPQVIVINLQWLVADTLPFIDFVREIAHSTKVVIVGADANDHHLADSFGADVFVYRPFQVNDLLQAVQ